MDNTRPRSREARRSRRRYVRAWPWGRRWAVSYTHLIIALRDLEKHPAKTGKGRAWFAIVAGAIGSVLLVVGVFVRATQ